MPIAGVERTRCHDAWAMAQSRLVVIQASFFEDRNPQAIHHERIRAA